MIIRNEWVVELGKSPLLSGLTGESPFIDYQLSQQCNSSSSSQMIIIISKFLMFEIAEKGSIQ